MLRVAGRRAFRGIRGLSVGPPSREPGVVGVTAGPNAREELTELYKQTLDAVKVIPEDAAYRVNVEKITRYRLGVVEAHDQIEAIEGKLGVGQMGEIMLQAKDELELIPYMTEWQPWKTADGQKSSVKIELID